MRITRAEGVNDVVTIAELLGVRACGWTGADGETRAQPALATTDVRPSHAVVLPVSVGARWLLLP